MDSVSKSFSSNRHLKEEFVSNLGGSSMLEMAVFSAIVPILVLLRQSLCSNRVSGYATTKISLKNNVNTIAGHKHLGAYMATLALDFLVTVLPLLLFLTLLAKWTYIGAILLALLLFFSNAAKGYHFSSPLREGNRTLRENITSYRVSLMILTCVCILAVDFRIFPRKYAKTETYGTSLMDLGVGSFVLANALVSRQARNVSPTKWKTALKSTAPLIILGFARLVSTSSVDYQVHVGEYGVHWNFFFTLAAVSLLTSIINIPPQYCGFLGFLILIGYQISLMHGLNVYLISNKRSMDLVSQNKEGIFSIFGYWSLYLIGVQLGNYLFFGNHLSALLRSNKRTRILVWSCALLFWLLTVLLDSFVERVSRRMCNLPYVTLVIAQNLQVIAILMLSEYIPASENSVIEEAMNHNLLAVFLLANVLTGLMNLSIDTLSATTVTALFILVSYSFIFSSFSGLVHFYGIRLKFW